MEAFKNFEATFQINEKLNEINGMRVALSSIAEEIQKFQDTETLNTVAENKINFSYKLRSHCESKIKYKMHQVSKLRKDLKAVCWVAKTLDTVKKKETTILASHLAFARGECVDLLQKYTNNVDTISYLYKENESLRNKLENFANFINLGYRELKSIQNEEIEEPSTLAQLKELIQSCGQYYADYCNENEKGMKMKQRNRFLVNKITILENIIKTIKDQIKALTYRNKRLNIENNQIKSKHLVPKSLNGNISYTAAKISRSMEKHLKSTYEKYDQNSGDSLLGGDVDLTSHLDIVNRLLSDQDTLLKDLNIITKEMSIV